MVADEKEPKRPRRARKHRLVIKGIPDPLHEAFKAMALKRRMPMTRLALEILARHVATHEEAEEAVDVSPERPIRPEPMF